MNRYYQRLSIFIPRTLFGRMIFSYLLLLFITLVLIGLLFNRMVSQYFISSSEWEHLQRAQKAAVVIADDLDSSLVYPQLIATVSTLAISYDAQLWVFDRWGRVIAQAQAQSQPETSRLSLVQEEIESVLQGNSVIKKSVAGDLQNMLVALPVRRNAGENADVSSQGEILGAIVVRAPSGSISTSIRNVTRLVLYAMLASVLIAFLLSLQMSKQLTRPLRRMNQAALRLASGNLKERIPEEGNRPPEEIRQITATFNYAVEQIEIFFRRQEELEHMRRDFVANVSHEFKGPLTSIRGFLELMADDLVEENDRKKYMKLILGNVAHLNYLVEDLLELSLLESGKIKLQREEVEPEDLLAAAHDEFVEQAEQKGVHFRVRLGEYRLPAIRVDRHRFRQVLTNLIQNALHYTPAGGGILLEAFENADGNVSFRICDTGTGIDPKELPRIWDRFYKADRARTRSGHAGTGLGLAIVKQIVDLHQGSISVKSEIGLGTCFTVDLPVESLDSVVDSGKTG